MHIYKKYCSLCLCMVIPYWGQSTWLWASKVLRAQVEEPWVLAINGQRLAICGDLKVVPDHVV